MAQVEEPRLIVTMPCGGEDGGVPSTDQAHGCSDAGGGSYVTASPSMPSDASDESVEYETARMIAKSREQGWSELKERDHESNAAGSSSHDQDTQVIWEELKRRDPYFFRDDVGWDLEVGRQIAEGAQAHIYEAKVTGPWWKLAVKVYKMEGFSLGDLQRQWPPSNKHSTSRYSAGRGFAVSEAMPNCADVHCGTFLKDGRFVFLMNKYWGDLRTLVNCKLSENNNQGPPFPYPQALRIMHQIAYGMKILHYKGVLHRDLKAANILVQVWTTNQHDGLEKYVCFVADFESSMLVQGTGFWRAPEVLQALLKKSHDQNEDVWIEQADVYSYAMTCYEILTGQIPFPQYFKSDWKKIIDGERPPLPHYLDSHPQILKFLKRCWHKEPLQRPTFKDLVVQLRNIRNLPTYKL